MQLQLTGVPASLADVFNHELQRHGEIAPTAEVLSNVASEVADILVAAGVIADRAAWCDLASMSGLEIPDSNYGAGN